MPPRNPVCRGRCRLLNAPVRPYANYNQYIVLQIAGGTPLVIPNLSFVPPLCEHNSEWGGTIVKSGNIIVSFRICLRRGSDHVYQSHVAFLSSHLLLRANQARFHIVFVLSAAGRYHVPSF